MTTEEDAARRWPGWQFWRPTTASGWCAAWEQDLTHSQVEAGWTRVLGAGDLTVLEERLAEQPNQLIV